MITESKIIEGQYLQDILRQPEALRETLAGFEDARELREIGRALAAGEHRRIVLTGMGSSLHALYPLHMRLTNRGLPSMLVETAELIHYFHGALDGNPLVIAVSQSGQSAEMVRLMELTQGSAAVVGVTNNDQSALARGCTTSVLMRAGAEASVSCKTYVATLLALEWLGAILDGDDLGGTRSRLSLAAPAAEAYLAEWRAHVEDLWDLLAGVKQVFRHRTRSLPGRGFDGRTDLEGVDAFFGGGDELRLVPARSV